MQNYSVENQRFHGISIINMIQVIMKLLGLWLCTVMLNFSYNLFVITVADYDVPYTRGRAVMRQRPVPGGDLANLTTTKPSTVRTFSRNSCEKKKNGI